MTKKYGSLFDFPLKILTQDTQTWKQYALHVGRVAQVHHLWSSPCHDSVWCLFFGTESDGLFFISTLTHLKTCKFPDWRCVFHLKSAFVYFWIENVFLFLELMIFFSFSDQHVFHFWTENLISFSDWPHCFHVCLRTATPVLILVLLVFIFRRSHVLSFSDWRPVFLFRIRTDNIFFIFLFKKNTPKSTNFRLVCFVGKKFNIFLLKVKFQKRNYLKTDKTCQVTSINSSFK